MVIFHWAGERKYPPTDELFGLKYQQNVDKICAEIGSLNHASICGVFHFLWKE
jgi:hypothetical protein